MSRASSGACLGHHLWHHLGHVWGIIWGMSGVSSGASGNSSKLADTIVPKRCCFTIESVARSELILSISGNLVVGLIRFGPDKNKRHSRWKKIKRKLITNGPFSLSADPVNGGGSNIGHYLALLTRFLLQNGFSSTTACLCIGEMSMWHNFQHWSNNKDFWFWGGKCARMKL